MSNARTNRHVFNNPQVFARKVQSKPAPGTGGVDTGCGVTTSTIAEAGNLQQRSPRSKHPALSQEIRRMIQRCPYGGYLGCSASPFRRSSNDNSCISRKSRRRLQTLSDYSKCNDMRPLCSLFPRPSCASTISAFIHQRGNGLRSCCIPGSDWSNLLATQRIFGATHTAFISLENAPGVLF